MSGITRIKIISDWHDWRTRLAEDHAGIADDIYQYSFMGIGLPLQDGVEYINVTKDDAKSRYDWQEGIDVILQFDNGSRATLQEKFLTFNENTATFEETKTSGSPGAWYYCTAQYYFVGYTRQYWDWKNRILFPEPIIDFQDWIMLDLAAMHRADAKNEIEWQFNRNGQDRRRASFRFVHFQNIPLNCIISQKIQYSKFRRPDLGDDNLQLSIPI